ncbi:hypothetical protein O181_049806 [Austropuccinia psidii MF-1]|uniref:Uncharacterized protein n=1 Tax=Austropuccinia psidii MF-1 TaxID=1389203 RepID=A0A9Q3DT31_9BASI|nr:hypothetical protein [Austropuccinia psidii MF-1]
MKVFLSRNGPRDPKQADRNNSGQLALSPQAWICPPPLLGHHPMVTLLLNWRKVIIRPMKDGDGKRTFKLGPLNKTHQIPPNKTHPFNVCLESKPRGNTLLTRVAPNGPRTYSKNSPNMMSLLLLAQVHPPNHLRMLRLMSQNQRWPQHNPWRNHLVGPKFTFLTLHSFSSSLLFPSPGRPATPRSIIIIDNTPPISPAPLQPWFLPWISLPLLPRTQPPPPPRCQAPLIPTMTLARNSPTCNQH